MIIGVCAELHTPSQTSFGCRREGGVQAKPSSVCVCVCVCVCRVQACLSTLPPNMYDVPSLLLLICCFLWSAGVSEGELVFTHTQHTTPGRVRHTEREREREREREGDLVDRDRWGSSWGDHWVWQGPELLSSLPSRSHPFYAKTPEEGYFGGLPAPWTHSHTPSHTHTHSHLETRLELCTREDARSGNLRAWLTKSSWWKTGSSLSEGAHCGDANPADRRDRRRLFL